MLAKKLGVLLLGTLFVVSGCAQIPDDDIVLLDLRIPVGIDATQAREIIVRRGFAPIEVVATPRSRFDEASQSFKQLPLSNIDIVKQNIGFVDLEGEPSGQLTCFARGYSRFVASGDRLICWTKDEDNKITWRQAGWRGAML